MADYRTVFVLLKRLNLLTLLQQSVDLLHQYHYYDSRDALFIVCIHPSVENAYVCVVFLTLPATGLACIIQRFQCCLPNVRGYSF